VVITVVEAIPRFMYLSKKCEVNVNNSAAYLCSDCTVQQFQPGRLCLLMTLQKSRMCGRIFDNKNIV
jgi:hypothetical protein